MQAKLAMERLPAMEAEIHRLRAVQSQVVAPAVEQSVNPVGAAPCAMLQQKIAQLGDSPEPVQLLQAAEQCSGSESCGLLPEVSAAVLTLRTNLMALPDQPASLVPTPEPAVVEEEDEFSAWLSAQSSNNAASEPKVAAAAGPVLRSELEALVQAVAAHIEQFQQDAVKGTAEGIA